MNHHASFDWVHNNVSGITEVSIFANFLKFFLANGMNIC